MMSTGSGHHEEAVERRPAPVTPPADPPASDERAARPSRFDPLQLAVREAMRDRDRRRRFARTGVLGRGRTV